MPSSPPDKSPGVGEPVRAYLAPFERSFRLFVMDYLEPFVVHGSRRLSDAELAAVCAQYAARLETLASSLPPA